MATPIRSAFAALLVLAAVASLVHSTAFGQEGHPLKGSWIGAWEGNEVHGDSVLLVLDWDGKNITGVINPGTDDMTLTKASLDPNGWKVTIEADAKDKAGAAVHYVLEGEIQDLELPNRSIVGTWKSQRGNGAFEVARQ
jgi:hypothetical protein